MAAGPPRRAAAKERDGKGARRPPSPVTEIWRCLVRLEPRPTPIPGALRWEARWLRKPLEQPVDFTTSTLGRGGLDLT